MFISKMTEVSEFRLEALKENQMHYGGRKEKKNYLQGTDDSVYGSAKLKIAHQHHNIVRSVAQCSYGISSAC